MPQSKMPVVGVTSPLLVRTIRAQKVIHRAKQDGYVIFTAVSLGKKRGGGFRELRETKTYIGYFNSFHINDVFEVTYEDIENKFYGEQRHIVMYHRIYPGTLEEIRTFLLSKKCGIGPKRTDALLEKYGLSVLDEIVNNPNVFDGLGLPEEGGKALQDEIVADRRFEDTLAFLQLHKLDYRYAIPLFEKYKEAVIDVLTKNPYAAYLDNIIDFKTADLLHNSIGYPENEPFRIAMAVYACLKRDSESNGNIFMRRDELPDRCNAFLAFVSARKSGSRFTGEEYDTALSFLMERELVIIDSSVLPGVTCIYLKRNFESEIHIAECIFAIQKGLKDYTYRERDVDIFLKGYQSRYHISLAPDQRRSVLMALTSEISVMTGGPGTGKTQTINTILAAIETLSPKATVRLTAPTGKAANRISELSNKPAFTIHRLLGLGLYHSRCVGQGELDCDFLIVDEYSMADIHLTYWLLRAVSAKTRVILVGDYDQLPSVGPGLVLRDFINSGCLPCVRLSQVFRQATSSNIIRNAHLIIESSDTGTSAPLRQSRKPNGDFYFIPADSPSLIRKTIVRSIARFHDTYHYPYDSIQVLSALKAPDVGVTPLNELLQNTFNPAGAPFLYHEREFRIGDKVIHCINNYELSVFNGETGVIKSFGYSSECAIEVSFPDRDVWYDMASIDQLDLAYAISVHRAQGSEFPIVIVPVHETLATGLNKNLLYTAITRGKKIVVVIGSPQAFADGIKRCHTLERNSNLMPRLQSALPAAPSIPSI